MDITHLRQLKDNPIKVGSSISFINKGISVTEIQQLEETWNNGNPFPKVLREFLFLAGNFCYVCDYGPTESQQDLQEWKRETMEDYNRVINRPFYVYSIYNDNFYFIFLDEGDNPIIYEANPSLSGLNWYKKLNHTIQSTIIVSLNRVKQGQNPN